MRTYPKSMYKGTPKYITDTDPTDSGQGWTSILTWSFSPQIQIFGGCSCLRADNKRTGLVAYRNCDNCGGHGILPIPLEDLK